MTGAELRVELGAPGRREWLRVQDPDARQCGEWHVAGQRRRGVSACTRPAIGVAAPVRMSVTVQAIAPLAGILPKTSTAELAMPCSSANC